MNKARVIAYYLPQFHPIPENNEWWGNGFTEWTNVGRAKPLFKGHYQPRVPADLGYYDLRLPQVREQQAQMAKDAGVEGFAYWHYWFAGKRLLETPFNEVLRLKEPNFPFCLAWANETWSGVWNNDHKRILMEQTYPGKADYEAHFYSQLTAFTDKRYIKVEDKLLFCIYKPLLIPNPKEFIDCWNELAIKNGLSGFYFIGITNKPIEESSQILQAGYDAVNVFRINQAKRNDSKIKSFYTNISESFFKGNIGLMKWDYRSIIKNYITEEDFEEKIIPSILPNWDNSARSGKRALIVHNSTPELFEQHLKEILKTVENKKNKILFLKSWNEWAEGNYMEPDLKFGNKYLTVFKNNIY